MNINETKVTQEKISHGELVELLYQMQLETQSASSTRGEIISPTEFESSGGVLDLVQASREADDLIEKGLIINDFFFSKNVYEHQEDRSGHGEYLTQYYYTITIYRIHNGDLYGEEFWAGETDSEVTGSLNTEKEFIVNTIPLF